MLKPLNENFAKVYSAKSVLKEFDTQEDVLVGLCKELDDKLHNCQVKLDIVSSALSSILQLFDNCESPIYYGVLKDKAWLKYKRMSSLSLDDMIYDGVGQVHMKTPYSGEDNVFVCINTTSHICILKQPV